MLGKHCFLSLYDCNKLQLDNEEYLVNLLEEAAKISGATVVQTIFKKFEPQGVTVLTLLSESHISIHTWPERGEAAVDIFTCGDHCKPTVGANYIVENLDPSSYNMDVVDR
jgi:S-adenosylmethionine decarboxylase